MEHDNFKEFCKMMYAECSSERRKYGEDVISFEDYVKENSKMLLAEYERQITQ